MFQNLKKANVIKSKIRKNKKLYNNKFKLIS